MAVAVRAHARPLTATDRDKLEGALLAALLLVYAAKVRATLDHLGLKAQPAIVPGAAKQKLAAFAKLRAQKVQDGINQAIAATLASLPDDATGADQQAALSQCRQKVDEHNDEVLIPFLLKTATAAALIETYQSIQSTKPGKTLAEAVDWTWRQNTDFEDDCTAADAASPAPLQELIAIGGGIPPTHPGCLCDLIAGDATGLVANAA